jgi:hypothetical protein
LISIEIEVDRHHAPIRAGRGFGSVPLSGLCRRDAVRPQAQAGLAVFYTGVLGLARSKAGRWPNGRARHGGRVAGEPAARLLVSGGQVIDQLAAGRDRVDLFGQRAEVDAVFAEAHE